MRLSVEMLTWGVINWGEGVRIRGTVLSKVITTSTMHEASNSYRKETHEKNAGVALACSS